MRCVQMKSLEILGKTWSDRGRKHQIALSGGGDVVKCRCSMGIRNIAGERKEKKEEKTAKIYIFRKESMT